MMDLNFDTFYSEMARKLEAAEQIVLATCADDIITTRLVCPINDGLIVMFSTGGNSLKTEQMRKNPNIALTLDGINIEAVAEIFGHPSGHPAFMEMYAKKYPQHVKKYESSPNDVLVIARTTKISIYKYTGKPCKDILHVKEGKAFRQEL